MGNKIIEVSDRYKGVIEFLKALADKLERLWVGE
jgi:hypothetical protein